MLANSCHARAERDAHEAAEFRRQAAICFDMAQQISLKEELPQRRSQNNGGELETELPSLGSKLNNHTKLPFRRWGEKQRRVSLQSLRRRIGVSVRSQL